MRQNLPLVEVEESFLILTDLMDVYVIRAVVDALLYGFDMAFRIRTARNRFREHVFSDQFGCFLKM